MNKKGNVFDVIDGTLGIALGAFIVIIAAVVLYHFNDGFQSHSEVPTEAKDFMSKYSVNYVKYMDWLVLALLTANLVFSVISAHHINTKPIFLIVGFLFLLIFCIAAVVINNVYYGFSEQAYIIPVLNQMVFTPVLLQNWLIVVLTYGGFVMVSLYGKGFINR